MHAPVQYYLRWRVLGLREDRIGRGMAFSVETRPSAIALRGEDAIELIADTNDAPEGHALGLSMRVPDYGGVDPVTAAKGAF